MAFLKFIYKAGDAFSPDWISDPVRRFRNGTPAEKARFCLEQAIILSYFEYLYGKKSTLLLWQYRDFFERWYMNELEIMCETTNSEYIKPIYTTCAMLIGKMPGKIDTKEVFRYLADDTIDCPHTVDKSFYEPYLKFKENVSDLRQYVENEQMNKVRSFTISHPCTIPSFKISGRFIVVNYEIEFSSYSFSYTNIKDIIEDMLEVDTIFTFLAGYHWSGKNTTGVFGVLASQCLTYDFNDLDLDSPMIGFVEIYSRITNPKFKPENSLALSTGLTQQRRKIVRFLIYLRKHHRIVFEDINMLADYADSVDTEDNHPLKQYFVSLPKEISSEAYTAFRNSRFAKFEELDKLRKGYRNATGGGDDQRTDEYGSDDAESPKKNKDAAPNSENQGTADELSGLESPTGIQDSSKNDEKPNQNDADSDTDTEQNSEQDQNPEEEQKEDENEEELPPLPRVSDKKGVKLKLSEGESSDTVLYREELRAYIDSLLQNPPSNLSVQTLSALKRIKANWLYLLDVECLYKFMSALIKMPKSLKVKPPKKEEK